MMHCDAHHLDDFTSDDFREAGLDADMADPAHDIGTFFAKLKWNQVAEPVSEVPSGIESNNARRIDVWRFNWYRWRQIVHSRIEAYL
jgi:hypothetical protein